MCGRFTLDKTPASISNYFGFNIPFSFEPQFNIAPSQKILAIKEHNDPAILRWGLIPPWAKESSVGYKMINARAETISEKTSFKAAYQKRRCLIPATGFFEWEKQDDRKQPYFIQREDKDIFCFAGLWEAWTDKNTGEIINSCTIITSEANKIMRPIHHRMPVIVQPGDYGDWTSGKPDPRLLDAYEWQGFEAYPVSTYVNNPRNEGPECIAEISLGGTV